MKWRIFSVLFLLVVLTPYAYMLRYRIVAARVTPTLNRIPLMLEDYVGSDVVLNSKALGILGADETMYRVYTGGDRTKVWFFLGYFGAAQENSQIHSPKHCYPGSGWNIYEEGIQEIEMAAGEKAIRRLYISDGNERRVVFYWFSTRSGIITNEFGLKWDQMKNSLLRKPQSTAFVRFSAEVGKFGVESETRDKLADFVEKMMLYIEAALKDPLGENSSPQAAPGSCG